MRITREFVVLLWVVSVGCQGTTGEAGPAMTANPVTAGSVRFNLAQGPLPIRVDLPQASTVNILVKDSRDVQVLAVTQLGFPKDNGTYLYGLCASGNHCDGLPTGTFATLPSGIYTAQVIAREVSASPLQCTFTPPAATRTIRLKGNLDQITDRTVFDSNDPRMTSNFTSSVTVYDSWGNPIQLVIYFVKNSDMEMDPDNAGDWSYFVTTAAANLIPEADAKVTGEADTPIVVGLGYLHFGQDGKLQSQRRGKGLSFQPRRADHAQEIDLVFGSQPRTGTGDSGFTQYAAPLEVTSLEVDGHATYIACASPDAVTDAPTPLPENNTAATRALIQVEERTTGVVDAYGYPNNYSMACVCKEWKTGYEGDIPPSLLPDAVPLPPKRDIILLGNLNVVSPFVGPFDLVKAKETSNFSATVTVFDPLGNGIFFDIYFLKADAAHTVWRDSGDWNYYVLVDSDALAPSTAGALLGQAGTQTVVALGALRFDWEGRLISHSPTVGTFIPKGGSLAWNLSFNLGTGTQIKGNGLDGLTQYAAPSSINYNQVVDGDLKHCSIKLPEAEASAFVCWEVFWPS